MDVLRDGLTKRFLSGVKFLLLRKLLPERVSSSPLERIRGYILLKALLVAC